MFDLPSLENPENLKQAFEVFNHLSQSLEESYRELENQVARLNRELAAARSERLKTLTEKEQLANKLQGLLEALPGGVIVIDGEGIVVECNPAAVALLGEPLLGQHWADIIDRSFEAGGDNPHERRLRNGRTVSISARSMGGQPGQILLLTDVSEMRALQDLVDQHKRLSAMGEMVASMAHQVRTPLAAAVLYASQLQGTQLDQEKRQRFAGRVLERLRHLERQVNDMLVFAREGRFIMGHMDVGTFLASLREAAEPHFAATGIELVICDRCGDARLEGNAEALLGACLNLMTNAIEAMRGEGRLEVHAIREGERLCLQVADNGPGIEPALQARIFEPFFTTRSSGTGLGLAVVDSIVKAHGGRVRCHSQPGKGTMFAIDLPLVVNPSPLPGGCHGETQRNFEEVIQ